jgi:hypothetical protein
MYRVFSLKWTRLTAALLHGDRRLCSLSSVQCRSKYRTVLISLSLSRFQVHGLHILYEAVRPLRNHCVVINFLSANISQVPCRCTADDRVDLTAHTLKAKRLPRTLKMETVGVSEVLAIQPTSPQRPSPGTGSTLVCYKSIVVVIFCVGSLNPLLTQCLVFLRGL